MKWNSGVVKWTIIAFKIGIMAYLGYYVYSTIDWHKFVEITFSARLSFIALALFIMIPNLFFDWLKWDYMVRLINKKIPKSKTFRSLLSGLTLSTVFNNPVADYGGRIVVLPELPKGSLIAFQFIEKTQILFLNVIAGSLSLIIMSNLGYFDQQQTQTFTIVSIFTGIFSLASFVIISIPSLLIPCISIFRRFFKTQVEEAVSSLNVLKTDDIQYLIFINILKVFVFNMQFYFALLSFGFVNIFISFLGSTATLMVKWVLEGFLFNDIGIRGAASVFFFSRLGILPEIALNCALIIFVINRIFPSLIGVFVVLTTDFKYNPFRRSVRLYRLQKHRRKFHPSLKHYQKSKI